MATINTTDPKPGYVYNQDDDTWYPLLGLTTQSLDSLTDVSITSPTTSQVLKYNGTVWVNGEDAGLPSLSGNAGKYLYTDGTTSSWAVVDLSSLEIMNIMGAY
jgi:hypothetical protein